MPCAIAGQAEDGLREMLAPMTNAQLYLALGVPVLLNAAMFGLLMAYMNAKFDAVNQRFEGINRRFDDMRDLWRTELRRVEDVIDARRKHLEEQHG